MPIHEHFRDAVKQRATMAHQGTPRRVPTMESSVPVHPWNTGAVVIIIVNDMVEFATLGKSSTVARVATR